MRKILAVIRREFIERVRTRAFIISTILFPLLMTTFTVLPALLLRRASGTKHVAVIVGLEGSFGERAADALASAPRRDATVPIPYTVERLPAVGRVEAVRDSALQLTGLSKRNELNNGFDGVLVLTDETLTTGRIQYYGTNVGSPAEMQRMEGILQPVVQRERLERLGVDPGVVLKAVGNVDLVTQKVADGKLTGQSGAATFGLAYGMVFILYLTLMIYGSQVMTSVVEEKTNRIVEVLASSLRPFELMLGKVIGVGLVGLFQLTIWAATALYLGSSGASFFGRIMNNGGGSAAASGGGPGFLAAISPALVIIFLVLFILGFLFYAAMFAAVGSMCSTVQDTQQVMMPVTLPIMLGIMTMFALINDPNGTLGRVITFIPFWAPFALPVRYSITPLPAVEVLGAIAVMIVSVLVVAWIAGRVYRVGILSYGKRATFRDVARWVRTT